MEAQEMDRPGMRGTARTLDPHEKQKKPKPSSRRRQAKKISGQDLQSVSQLSPRPAVLGISYLLLQPIPLF